MHPADKRGNSSQMGSAALVYGAVIIWTVVLLSGCAWLIRPPMDDAKARRMVTGIQQTNADLSQYKELANFRLEYENKVHSGSMALAAALPDRMRLALLSVVGQPLHQLVADGQTIRIRPHGQARTYKISQSAEALEPLIHIKIGIEQLQLLLVGRPKLPDFHAAQFFERNDGKLVIKLRSRFHLTRAVIEIEPATSMIKMFEARAEDGELLYRAYFQKWQQVGKYHVPQQFKVLSAAGHQLTINMRRFWPDVELSPSTFEWVQPEPSS